MWEPHTDITTVNGRSELNTDLLCLQPGPFSVRACAGSFVYLSNVLRLCDILLFRVY